jgi:hypothetical protein
MRPFMLPVIDAEVTVDNVATALGRAERRQVFDQIIAYF